MGDLAHVRCPGCGGAFAVDEDRIGDANEPWDDADTVSCIYCLRDIDVFAEERKELEAKREQEERKRRQNEWVIERGKIQ